jgi:NADH:ubiquinone oxidoreductase subunit 5 (subunit L)/multisubunit Na+/H+ antiporter MnhA subunit
MVFACGISSYTITMFHLANHAFFKALLFLSAGAVIHALHDEQDMRKMGGLNRLLPFTYIMTIIGSLALIGFPFLTGYFSKDFILEVACAKMHYAGNFAYWLGVLTATFTTFYSYRLLFLTFLNKTNTYKINVSHAHEPSIFMSIPLIVLAFGSMFVGYLTKDLIIGFGSSYWGNAVFILSDNLSYLEAEYLPYHIKMIPFVFSHFGLFVAYHTTTFFFNVVFPYTSTFSTIKDCSGSVTSPVLSNLDSDAPSLSLQKHLHLRELTNPFLPLFIFLSRTWGFDDFYNRFIVQKFVNFGYDISFKLLDLGWIAYLGPFGISRTISFFSRQFSSLSTGFVYHYAFIFLLGLLLFLSFFFLSWNPLIDGDLLLIQSTTVIFFFILTFFFLLLQKDGASTSKGS